MASPRRSKSAFFAATVIHAALIGPLLTAEAATAANLAYEVDISIRYDVTQNGVLLPGTEVWGLASPYIPHSGILDLTVDGAGNVTGMTRPSPITHQQIVAGGRVYSADRIAFIAVTNATWGTPVGRVAPLTGGVVQLTGSYLGDFGALHITSGFLEDGNSGDFFSLVNGVGLDGKLEFTATDVSGMSVTIRSKNYSGFGTGTYLFGVDTGSIAYLNGGNSTNVDLMGVTQFYVDLDRLAGTFSTTSPQVLLEDAPWPAGATGRGIDLFGGTLDAAGAFAGTGHWQGMELIALDFTGGSGLLQDGNSTGFDLSDGLVLGDSINVVLTGLPGLFSLAISGQLISQSTPTSVENAGLPRALALSQNTPNPFNPTTNISFALSREGRARLTVFDVSGKLVRELVNRRLPAGSHSTTWDGADRNGDEVASGIYLYRLDAEGEIKTGRAVLVR